MDPDLDRVLRRLAEVADALAALPEDAFAERFRLLTERDQLRETAAAFHTDWDADRPSDDLLAELRARRGQLERLRRGHVDVVTQSGGGTAAGPGAGGMGGTLLNQGMDRAQGVDVVRARIAALEAILVGRGVDPRPGGA